MNIILIGTQVFELPPRNYSGLEMIVSQLAQHLAKKHKVYLVAPNGSYIPNVEIIESGPASPGNYERDAFLKYRDIITKIIERDPQNTIISSHSWGMYEYLLKIKNPSINITHTFHGPNILEMPKEKFLREQIMNGEWNLIGISKAQAKYHSDALGGAPVHVIYNGVDPNIYKFWDGYRDDAILYLGVMNREKGADKFAEMMIKYNYKAKMIGEDTLVTDQNFVRQLIAYINAEGKNIEFWGTVSHEYKLYSLRHSKLLVSPLHPMWFESFGLYFVESSMVGTPVIVTKSGAMTELTEDLPDKFKAYKTVEDLENALPSVVEELNSNFPKISKIFRDNAMKYTVDKMVENYEKFFEKVLYG